ncbi:MAG: beta-lactamase family protein [Acidobacteria bacterium]|nr:beta-lactamase family protein [Acidobacteriota bacterium]
MLTTARAGLCWRAGVVAACCAVLAPTGGPALAQPASPGQPARATETATLTNPPARFADPARAAALAAAFPEVDRLFAEYARAAHVPGMAWGVIVDGRLVHTGTFGVQDVATNTPVTPESVFRIASMTKSFTAVAILLLRDEGRLALDDLAERYVPELARLRYPTADAPRLTVRHLLTHAAGFPEDNPWGDQQLALSDQELGALLGQGIPFSTSPGTAYEYSNYGFAILGRIVTRVSDQPYRDFVRTRVLEPLGLGASTLGAAAVPSARLAHGYRWEDARWKEEPPLADGAFGAMGGMLTSLRDLSRYVGWMMSAWPPRDEADPGPLRRSSLREMQQVWRSSPATARAGAAGLLQLNAGGYGYGLRVSQTCAYGHVVAHSGGLPGFGSQMRWLPEHGVGLVAMGSLTYTNWGPRLDAALAALTRTGALQPRQPQPSAALTTMRGEVTGLLQQWDDRRAEAIAANNLFKDLDRARRRDEVAALRERHGTCHGGGAWMVENALRGEWVMPCERGAIRVAITLAPTIPPRVQYLSLTGVDSAMLPPPRGACEQ